MTIGLVVMSGFLQRSWAMRGDRIAFAAELAALAVKGPTTPTSESRPASPLNVIQANSQAGRRQAQNYTRDYATNHAKATEVFK